MVEDTLGETLVSSGINGLTYIDKQVQLPVSTWRMSNDQRQRFIESFLPLLDAAPDLEPKPGRAEHVRVRRAPSSAACPACAHTFGRGCVARREDARLWSGHRGSQKGHFPPSAPS